MNTPFGKSPNILPDELRNDLGADATESDVKLVEELMKLSNSNPPDPYFVNDLSKRLQKIHPGDNRRLVRHRSLWFALAGSATVIVLILFGFPIFRPVIQPNPSVTPIDGTRSPTIASPGPMPTSLPILPLLGPSSVQASANLSEQFPNARWTLQASLPNQPTSAMVYKNTVKADLDVDSVRKLANQFGMAGHIYARLSGQTDFSSYLVKDGKSELSVYGSNRSFTYIPDVFMAANEHRPPLPFEQMSEKAIAFLKEKK